MPVRGGKQIMQRYKMFVKQQQDKAHAAIRNVLVEIGTEADMLTPQDLGTLLQSRYSPKLWQEGNRIFGAIGYTAFYAAFVHDAPGVYLGANEPRSSGNGYYWDPNGAEPEFLEKGVRAVLPRAMDIIRRAHRV